MNMTTLDNFVWAESLRPSFLEDVGPELVLISGSSKNEFIISLREIIIDDDNGFLPIIEEHYRESTRFLPFFFRVQEHEFLPGELVTHDSNCRQEVTVTARALFDICGINSISEDLVRCIRVAESVPFERVSRESTLDIRSKTLIIWWELFVFKFCVCLFSFLHNNLVLIVTVWHTIDILINVNFWHNWFRLINDLALLFSLPSRLVMLFSKSPSLFLLLSDLFIQLLKILLFLDPSLLGFSLSSQPFFFFQFFGCFTCLMLRLLWIQMKLVNLVEYDFLVFIEVLNLWLNNTVFLVEGTARGDLDLYVQSIENFISHF